MKKILFFIILILAIFNISAYIYLKHRIANEAPKTSTLSATSKTTDAGSTAISTTDETVTAVSETKTEENDLVTFEKTVQVTPDSNFSDGGLGYIHYVPATDTFIVMIATKIDESVYGCGKGLVYKEYTTDMKETGKYGILVCAGADVTTALIDDDLYAINMTAKPSDNWYGWHLSKFDAQTKKKLAETDITLNYPTEQDGGPTIGYINGQLDLTGEYRGYEHPEIPPDLSYGSATIHNFFTTDLKPVEKVIFSDVLHVPEGTSFYKDDIHYYVAADSTLGGLILLKYDKDHEFLGSKDLQIEKAFFPTGVAYDDDHYYVAYNDTSQRINENSMPFFQNIHLAIYDENWDLLEDVAVTNYSKTDGKQPGSPYVMLHDSKLYVSYVTASMDPVTYEEGKDGQTFVSVYDINK